MKKNFRILLVALFAVLGFTNAWAALPAEIEYGGCTYTVTDQDATAKTAKVTLKSGVTVSAGVIQLPGHFSYTMGSDTYTVSVTQIDPVTLPLKNLTEAVSVTIPKEIVAIPENCFYGCTYLKTITFEAGSAVTTIGTHAFATTQIDKFDFSPCLSLSELPNEVFVETGLTNTYITEVKVPTSALFKHINGAFKNLKKITKIEGLGESWIQEIISDAFYGCDELKELSLPGKGLRYIDKLAFQGSNIETLSINVSSLLSLGGGTVNPSTYAWTADATPANNLYGKTEVNKTPLKSLTLTGTLKGQIAYNAFAFCDKLDAVLDFKGMTFGSTGTIQANAFNTCYYKSGSTERGIKGVKIGDITDNTSGGFTIAGNAFVGCQLLAIVEIGDITTASAVGAKAFGEYLKDVTIGTVKASAAAFAAQAFVWKKIDNASLKLATGEGDYLNSNDATTTIIIAETFNMSAITGLDAGKKYPTIQIGEIRSKGGVFAENAITVPAALEALSFGAIADNGLNVKIFSDDTDVTTIDFNGAIGMHGIKNGAFSNLTKITTLNFGGLLAESAVDAGSFNITNGAGTEKLNYTVTSIPDYTVNPFAKNAFTTDASVDKDTERFIELNKTLFASLKANYEDATVGLATDGKFEIYLVKFAEAPAETPSISFTLYRNDNATSEAWGRYDLGSFVKENKDGAYTQTTMIIPRVQKIKQSDDTEVTAKLTLYGIYTDEDDVNKEATIYMVPLHVINGKYEITKYNSKLIIAKATISGSFVDKEIEWTYDNATAPTKNSVWTTIPGYAFSKQTAADNVTNQQLWDKTKNLYALFGSCAPDGATARDDIWGTNTNKPMYDLYIMSNPAKNKGFRVDKNVVAKGGAYIAPTWYFALLKNYGNDAAPARVVWLDDSQATAIFGVKEVKTAESNDDAIYNLQGIRVSAPVKGQLYIQNGKKFIAK